MSPQDAKIFKFNQYQKTDKLSFIIYADLGFTIERIDGCKKNPENSSIATVRKIFH